MAPEMEEFIRDILQRHAVMTLATIRADGFPQAAVVTYVSDGTTLYFVAGADAQKIDNIRRCDKVSLTILRDVEDWDKIAGLSMAAVAQVVADAQELRHVLDQFIAKFPSFAGLLPALDPTEIVVVRLRPKAVALIGGSDDIGDGDMVELWKDAA